MHENPSHRNDEGSENPRTNGLSGRDFLTNSAAMAGATFLASSATVSAQPDLPRPLAALIPVHGGLLYPQQNQHRNMLDLSGLWQFQLDPHRGRRSKGLVKHAARPTTHRSAVQLERSVRRCTGLPGPGLVPDGVQRSFELARALQPKTIYTGYGNRVTATWWSELRRDLAILNLVRNEVSLGEIAYALGFSSPAVFHRAFRHWTGLTPGAYQATQQQLH